MNEQQYLIATQRAIDELARRCTEALAPAEYVQSIHDIGAAILALLAEDETGDDAEERRGMLADCGIR